MNHKLSPNWSWVKLGDVSEILNGYAFKSISFKNEGKYQVVKIGNVRPGSLKLEERPAFVDVVEEKILSRYLLRKDDLIISLTGTRKKRDYGYVAIVTNQKNLLLNQRLAIIRLFKEYNSKFFLYLLKVDLFLDQFFKFETGNVGQGNVGINGIKNSLVPVPPFIEQKKIVAKIEELFSELDKGIEQLAAAKKQLKTYRQAVLSYAFSGKLLQQRAKSKEHSAIQKAAEPGVAYRGNGLPEGWKWVRLGEETKILSGNAFKSGDFISSGIPVIKISNVGYSKFSEKNQEYLPEKFLKDFSNYCVYPNDIIFALTRPITSNRTKICYYPEEKEPALLNQRVSVIRIEDKTKRRFVYHYLHSKQFKEHIKSKFNETLQPNLSVKDFYSIMLPICSEAKQTQIVEEIESRFSVADKLEQTIDEGLKKSETLRQSILKKAFEGRIV